MLARAGIFFCAFIHNFLKRGHTFFVAVDRKWKECLKVRHRKEEIMTSLSEKELSCINESLAEEELLVKKYQMLAQQTQDREISAKMEEIASRHQRHFDQIYSLLG